MLSLNTAIDSNVSEEEDRQIDIALSVWDFAGKYLFII